MACKYTLRPVLLDGYMVCAVFSSLKVTPDLTALGRKVVINAQGDRESDYQILSYTGEEFKVIGSYISVDNKITIQSSGWDCIIFNDNGCVIKLYERPCCI